MSLKDALDMIEDCGSAYRLAENHIKKIFNQVIFSKLWVEPDGHITAEFREPFNMIVAPLTDVICSYRQEKTRGTKVLTDFFLVIANCIQKFFGNGWSNDLLR